MEERLDFYQNVWLLLFYNPPENLVFIYTVDAIECIDPFSALMAIEQLEVLSVPVISVLKGHL